MKYKLIILAFLVAVIFVGGVPVAGQGSPSVFKSVKVESRFPEGLMFTATVDIPPPDRITEIRLEMKIKGSNRSSYAYLEDFQPGSSVTGTYLLRADGAQYKPPGTLIEYFFVVTDSAGGTLETPKQSVLYQDNRFVWKVESLDKVDVYYHGGTQEKSTAQAVLDAAVKTIKNMGPIVNISPVQPYRILVYNNVPEMREALPFQSETMERELIVEGQAWYEYGLLLMLGSDSHPGGVASHEMTHMLLAEATKNVFVSIPAWFNEGLAEYGNIDPGQSYDAVLDRAIKNKSLFPLRHLQTYPGKSEETLLLYGQGRAVVKFMVDTYGADKIEEIVAGFKNGLQMDANLLAVYGLDQDGIDNAWRASRGIAPVEPSALDKPPATQPAPAPEPVPSPVPTTKRLFSCAGL